MHGSRSALEGGAGMTSSALEGIRVVEYATMVSGPYCGKLLADLGAEVVKVEPPEGDPARAAGPFPEEAADPEKSALFLYLNTSKRGVTLDLDLAEDLARFRRLAAWADILIDNHPPSRLEGLGMSWEALHGLNPSLVYVSITPYGRTGPWAGAPGDELTLIHAGGLANLLPSRSVDVTRAPVKPAGYMVGYHGGIAAALASLATVLGREASGTGQFIDISLEDVVVNLVAPSLAGARHHHTSWRRVPDRPPAMGRMQTSDGYVTLGAADDHHFRAMRELMGWPAWAAWDEWDDRQYRLNHLMDIAPMMETWMRRQKKEDIHHRAAGKRIPIGPFNSARDVMESPQYRARKYFIEVDHPASGRHWYAGWPYRLSASPARVSRPAPLLGQHNGEVFSALPIEKDVPRRAVDPTESQGRLPLEGVRVLDFSWVWAGPYACMLLADLGAEVIKIEGHRRSDLTRRAFPWPLPEPAPLRLPPSQGMSYNSVNMNKKSLTLDLGRERGMALALKLAAKSDVVLDNMRPGVMAKMGLGYEALKAVRPDIVVLASSSRGLSGPETDYLGFATIHQAVGGLGYLTGYPDDHPSTGSPGDADIMNAMVAAFAVVAALHHRRRTGQGQFIDYSQCEGVSSLLGEYLLSFEMTGRIPERTGNTHPRYAPHAVYRCWGVDRWLALEVHSDREFTALARVVGRPELAQDPRFFTMEARKKNEAELDRILGDWIRQRDRDWMVGEFVRAGLMAAPSREAGDIYADRHLRARGSIVGVEHPELGLLELIGPLWRMSACQTPRHHAPLLGQHNRYVLGEILGLSGEEIARLADEDIILKT